MSKQTLNIRAQAIAMLTRPGITHDQIAKALNCSPRTIRRIQQDIRPMLPTLDAKLAEIQGHIDSQFTPADRAAKYVQLARDASNETCSLSALIRIDDLHGIVTEKERLRRQPFQPQAPGPMFVFPIDFGGLTITSSKDAIDVTPSSKDDDSE